MTKITKNILSLNHEEAMDFFMKSKQYHGFELPEYFTFDEILKYVRETIGDVPYEQCVKDDISPNELSDVNLDILLNKDGRKHDLHSGQEVWHITIHPSPLPVGSRQSRCPIVE